MSELLQKGRNIAGDDIGAVECRDDDLNRHRLPPLRIFMRKCVAVSASIGKNLPSSVRAPPEGMRFNIRRGIGAPDSVASTQVFILSGDNLHQQT